MDNNHVMIAKTKEGAFELVVARYGWKKLKRGVRSYEPTKHAQKILEKYVAWQNLSLALKDNSFLQAKFEKMFAPLL
jgi:hypothetical protein